MDDLFAGKPTPPAVDPADPEEWTLDEPAAPLRPQGPSLPAAPIPADSATDFESNPAAASPAEPVLDAVPAPVTPPPVTPARLTPAAAPLSPPPDDAFEMDEELPVLPPRPVVESPAPSSSMEDPTQPDDEYSSPTRSPEPPHNETQPAAPARRDIVGMAAAAIVLLALLGLFAGILYVNRPTAGGSDSQPNPRLPLVGQLATLPEITSGWRSRQPGDLVSTVDVSLPTPSRQQPAFVPEVRFSVDPAAAKTGFLRFIFLDPDGKISGDVRVLKVSGNSIEPLASGASITAPGTAVVYGSLGFMDRPGFVSYASGASPRWSVEVSESSDYNSKEAGWAKLQTFEIRNSTAP